MFLVSSLISRDGPKQLTNIVNAAIPKNVKRVTVTSHLFATSSVKFGSNSILLTIGTRWISLSNSFFIIFVSK